MWYRIWYHWSGERYRLDVAGRGEAEDLAVEGQLGLGRAPDGVRPAEAVPLARERHVRHRHALLAECGHHHLGLVRRDDPVVEPLEEDDRAVEAVDVPDRRALLVDALRLGPRADERVGVARLELVRVGG